MTQLPGRLVGLDKSVNLSILIDLQLALLILGTQQVQKELDVVLAPPMPLDKPVPAPTLEW
jgi:hypothetical protein